MQADPYYTLEPEKLMTKLNEQITARPDQIDLEETSARWTCQ